MHPQFRQVYRSGYGCGGHDSGQIVVHADARHLVRAQLLLASVRFSSGLRGTLYAGGVTTDIYSYRSAPVLGFVGKVYRRRFVSARLAATLLADGVPCFAICACPALVIKRDCSYISIHFSLEIAEISLPIASSGKSSGDSK